MHAESIERNVPDAPVPPVAAGRQRGAALMIMLLILVLGAAALFAHDLAGRSAATARLRKSATALAEAKEALLGYAIAYDATHPGEYGFLPCPDISAAGLNPEGSEDTALCGLRYQTMMGRLPWRSLGIAPARNDTGECLLYVVSGTWKAAGLTQSEMLNTDSNGQLRLIAADGTMAAGTNAADRPVALIIAPNGGLAGQLRLPLPSGVTQCSGNFVLSNYLDLDAVSGIDNSSVSLLADAIDDFMAGDPAGASVNDQFSVITRAELENRLTSRADVTARMQALTQAVAKCIADYGRRNSGGAGDRRLPWPAPVDLAQYRSDGQYDDAPVGGLSGRVADRVNDSNLQTGNLIAGVLTGCNAVAVPEWTAAMLTLWRNWKDHLFYAVAGSFRPDALPHSTCGTCLRVTALAAALLNSQERYAVPAFTPVLLNLALIGAMLAGYAFSDQPVIVLAWGVFIAGVLQFAFQLPYLGRLGLLVMPRPSLEHPGVRQVGRLLLPAVFAASVSQINSLVDTILASTLATGSISWLYYADRLLELPVGLVAVALGTVMLPNLSRLAAAGDEHGFRATLDWGLRMGVLLGLPAAVALYVLALPLVATMFHYGEMTAFDVRMAALAVQAFAAGLLPLVLVKVLAPAYFAREDTRTPFRIALVAVATNVVLNLLTYRWFGHVGLALATSTSAWVNGGLLLRGLVRSGRYVPAAPVAHTTYRTCVASAVMAGVLILCLPDGDAWLAMPGLIRGGWLAAGVAAGAAAYAAVLLLTGERPRELMHRA